MRDEEKPRRIEDQIVVAPAMVMDYPEDLPQSQSEHELSDGSDSEVRIIGASLPVPIDYDEPTSPPTFALQCVPARPLAPPRARPLPRLVRSSQWCLSLVDTNNMTQIMTHFITPL